MPAHERAGGLSPYLLKKAWEESQSERSTSMFEDWKQLRRRAQTELFWLCRLLNYNVTEKAHREMCENFFLSKNPDTPLDEFSPDKKDLLLFAPRDAFKSSIANADFVQFIVCWPDVKLAVQSSKMDRAAPFVQEVKNFFLVREEPDGNCFLGTRFAVLFPEHLLPERSRGADGEFTTPARKRFSKEPTCLSIGIEESRASVHFHVLRSDDAVSESNSGRESSQEARTNIGKKLLESRNLGDVRYYIGTPQDAGDGYALLKESLGDDLVLVVKSAWRVREEAAQKAEAELVESDFDLLFAFDAKGKSKLSYKVLKSFERADKERFSTQQLCISALQKQKIEILAGMIESHILPRGPDLYVLNPAPVVSTWDIAYSTENHADFSVGCAGSRDDIRGAILKDIQRGRYFKADLIRAMVSQAVQFRVNVICIESTNGVLFLEDDIIAALQKAGMRTTRVEFIPVDRVLDAKGRRFKSVYDALKSDKLWFALDPVQASFLNELTRPKGKKRDDVTDALGHLVEKCKEPIDLKPKEQPASQAQIILQEKRLREFVYGTSDKPWKGTEPEGVYGYRVEELKPDPPPTEWEGYPVVGNEAEYLYGKQ